jgi:hypothetical protein
MIIVIDSNNQVAHISEHGRKYKKRSVKGKDQFDYSTVIDLVEKYIKKAGR